MLDYALARCLEPALLLAIQPWLPLVALQTASTVPMDAWRWSALTLLTVWLGRAVWLARHRWPWHALWPTATATFATTPITVLSLTPSQCLRPAPFAGLPVACLLVPGCLMAKWRHWHAWLQPSATLTDAAPYAMVDSTGDYWRLVTALSLAFGVGIAVDVFCMARLPLQDFDGDHGVFPAHGSFPSRMDGKVSWFRAREVLRHGLTFAISLCATTVLATLLYHDPYGVLGSPTGTHGAATMGSWWNGKVFGCLLVLHLTLRFGLLLAPQNFTLAEISVLVQGVGLLFFDAVIRTFSQAGYLSILPTVLSDHRLQTTMVYYMIQALVLGILLTGLLLYPLMATIHRYRPTGSRSWPLLYRFCSLLFYVVVVALAVGPLGHWVSFMVGRHHRVPIDPFLWTLEMTFLRPRHLYVAIWWLTCLAVSVPVVKWVHRMDSRSGLALDRRRKVFHLIAVLLFIPSILWTPHFMALGFACAIALFVFLEYVRVFAIWIPLPNVTVSDLHRFLISFTEQIPGSSSTTVRPNDSPSKLQRRPSQMFGYSTRSWDLGPLILSHLYLLAGCALPLWIVYPSTMPDPFRLATADHGDQPGRLLESVAACSGVVCVGLGDAMASLCGQAYGQHRWVSGNGRGRVDRLLPPSPLLRKTVEGSLGFLIGCFLGYGLTWILLTLGHAIPGWWSLVSTILLVTIGSCLLEAFSCQNDNLVVPLWTVTAFMLAVPTPSHLSTST